MDPELEAHLLKCQLKEVTKDRDKYRRCIEKMRDDKLAKPMKYPPKQCPWCGAKQLGGGRHTVYYKCGSHIWVTQVEGYEVIRGHNNGCERSEDNGSTTQTSR